MSSDLKTLTAVGHGILAHKYYAVATGTVLFYDYLLTLEDEVKYFWSGKKSWMFWLFLTNRYFPMSFQLWQFTLGFSPQINTKLCYRTVWYPFCTFVVCTLLAQVVLTTRIYAVTVKNIPITVGFAVITISQLALGMYIVSLTVEIGAQELLPIPFDAFRVCFHVEHGLLEVGPTSISLFYDLLAFLLIIFSASRVEAPGSRFPTILTTLAEDSTRYFIIIFTSHLSLGLTLAFAPSSLKLLPGPGVLVYLPVMISRIMLSLRKAADPMHDGWSLPTINTSDFQSVVSASPRRGPDGGQNIPLSEIQTTLRRR